MTITRRKFIAAASGLLVPAGILKAQYHLADPGFVAGLFRPPAVGGGGGSPPSLVDTGSVNRDDASDNPETWTLAQSALTNGCIVVALAINDSSGGTIGTVSYDGSTMTQIAFANNANNTTRAYLYALAVGSKGSGTYTISVAGFSARNFVGQCTSWSGANQGTPAVSGGTDVGTGTAASLTFSSATDETVVDCLSYFSAASAAITGGQTAIWNNNDSGANVDGAGSRETGASSTTVSYSIATSVPYAYAAIALKPAS